MGPIRPIGPAGWPYPWTRYPLATLRPAAIRYAADAIQQAKTIHHKPTASEKPLVGAALWRNNGELS